MTVETYDITSRDQWLALRRHDLTASDIAAVAGLDPWKSPLRVYAEKTGLVGEVEDNAAMRRGRWLEGSVAVALRELHPSWEIRPAGIYLCDPEIRLGATPDFIVTDPDVRGFGNCQAKIVSRAAWEREWHEQPPVRYAIQTLCEAMLLDADYAMLAALVIDMHTAELVEYSVPRHAGAETRIKELAKNFWADIEAGKKPPADYRQDRRVIEAMYAAGGGGSIDLSRHNHIAELCEQYIAWQQRRSNADGAIEELGSEIKQTLGDHDAGEHPQFSISWRQQNRKETLLPATQFRVLRVTRRGKDR